MNYLKTGLRQDGGIVRRLSVVVVSAIAVSLGSCAANALQRVQNHLKPNRRTQQRLMSCKW
jgi:hypothetical protein